MTKNVGLIDESGSIYRAITEDFKRRMRNWTRSKDGALIATMGDLGEALPSELGLYETQIPVLFGEADETEEAVCTLPLRYQQSVRQFWRFEGLSLREHARRRIQYMEGADENPNLKYETFERWVMKGHELLVLHLAKLSTSRYVRRAQTERAIEQARPADVGDHALKLFGLKLRRRRRRVLPAA